MISEDSKDILTDEYSKRTKQEDGTYIRVRGTKHWVSLGRFLTLPVIYSTYKIKHQEQPFVSCKE